MINDPIVNHVRKIREKLTKIFNYDVDAIFTDLREKQKEHSDRVVNLKNQRKAESTTSTNKPC